MKCKEWGQLRGREAAAASACRATTTLVVKCILFLLDKSTKEATRLLFVVRMLSFSITIGYWLYEISRIYDYRLIFLRWSSLAKNDDAMVVAAVGAVRNRVMITGI